MERTRPLELSRPETKVLWGESAARCGFRDPAHFSVCRVPLAPPTGPNGSPVVIGEAAHMEGARPGSARYRADMSPRERSAGRNFILLCAHHHKVIDAQAARYPAKYLQRCKRRHERWVRYRLSRGYLVKALASVAAAAALGVCGLSLSAPPPERRLPEIYRSADGIVEREFEYDARGNVVAITTSTPMADADIGPDLETRFEYDELSRLISAQQLETRSTSTYDSLDRRSPRRDDEEHESQQF